MQIHTYNVTFRILLLILCMSLLSCSGKRPLDLGITDSRLTPCPSSPNCVSSDADDNEHKIEPFQLALAATEAWQIAIQSTSELPRTVIIKETSDYLHAECTSTIFGFVDDLELHLRPDEGIISVRSASRLGTSDFGVNRKRVEDLRSLLIRREAIKQE